jgi:hypothetical protein
LLPSPKVVGSNEGGLKLSYLPLLYLLELVGIRLAIDGTVPKASPAPPKASYDIFLFDWFDSEAFLSLLKPLYVVFTFSFCVDYVVGGTEVGALVVFNDPLTLTISPAIAYLLTVSLLAFNTALIL